MRIDKLCIGSQFLNPDKGLYLIVCLNVQQILDRTAFSILCSFRNLINRQPETTALRGEEHHRCMHRCRINIFNEVFIACFRTLHSYSSSSLSLEICQRSTLDIAHVRNSNDHLIISIEIFRIQIFRSIDDIGLTFISILVFDFLQFIFDNLHTKIIVFKDLFQVGNLFFQFFVFSTQFVLFQSCQLT